MLAVQWQKSSSLRATMDRASAALPFPMLLLPDHPHSIRKVRADMPEVVFLTRKGCPGSTTMLKNLVAALASLGMSDDLVTVDIGELPADDIRTGYGSPTILVDGRDLFGESVTAPAAPT